MGIRKNESGGVSILEAVKLPGEIKIMDVAGDPPGVMLGHIRDGAGVLGLRYIRVYDQPVTRASVDQSIKMAKKVVDHEGD